MSKNNENKESKKTLLRDVVPCEFMEEYTDTPAFKLLDIEVVKCHDGHLDSFPTAHRNVMHWWELANGKVVGWNENPAHGWSFPVSTVKTFNKKNPSYSEHTLAIGDKVTTLKGIAANAAPLEVLALSRDFFGAPSYSIGEDDEDCDYTENVAESCLLTVVNKK